MNFIFAEQHANAESFFNCQLNNLPEFCHRAFDAGIAYETIMHRNFRWIIFVVTPKDQLQKAETLIKNRLNNLISEYNGKLEIQCIAEEAI